MNENTAIEAPAVEQGKTVNVTAYFRLSEAGQKAAVLAGLSAVKIQSIAGPLPVEHLDLCRIMDDGAVLMPTFHVGVAEATTLGLKSFCAHVPLVLFGECYSLYFDAPPSSVLDVAQAMIARRDAVAAKRAAKEAEQVAREAAQQAERIAWIAGLQAALDADPVAIPSTGSKPSSLYYTWDAESKDPTAVEIRRRRAVQVAAEAQAKADIAAAKAAFVRSWLVAHGTPDQVERFDARLLDQDEYRAAMEDAAFAPLAEFPLYEKISNQEVRSEVDDPDDQYAEVKAIFRSQPAGYLSAEQWSKLKTMRAALPEATIEPKTHEGSLDSDDVSWVVSRDSALATIQFGPFEFRRDYAL